MMDDKKDTGLPAKKRSTVIMVVECKWKGVIPLYMAAITLSILLVSVMEDYRS